MKILQRILLMMFTLFVLQGCGVVLLAMVVAPIAGLAKIGFASQPQMEYVIEGKELQLHISTYSLNIASVKNMTDVGAAIIADEILKCPFLEITYAKWPNSMFKAAIKIDTVVTYRCTGKSRSSANDPISGAAGVAGAVIIVEKKLRFENDLVKIVKENNLLRPKGAHAAEPAPQATKTIKVRAKKSAGVPMVRETQEKLKLLGYDVGIVDGLYGAKTEIAIQDFQLDNDLEVDGKPSESLLRMINARIQ